MDYNKIKKLAVEKNINLKELADKISMSETGLRRSIREEIMRIDVLEKISSVLKVDICLFFKDKAVDSIEVIALKNEIKDLLKENEKNEKYIHVLEEHISLIKDIKNGKIK